MEKMTDRISWIKELIQAEEQMEQTGVVDASGFEAKDQLMAKESLKFLAQIKNECIESAGVFNELKASALGRIKVYGIAKTHSDFMLFRNGFKMIFSLSEAGQISIRFNFIGPNFLPSQIPTAAQSTAQLMDEHKLIAEIGPLGDLRWTFQGQDVKIESIVRHYMSMFIRESTR